MKDIDNEYMLRIMQVLENHDSEELEELSRDGKEPSEMREKLNRNMAKGKTKEIPSNISTAKYGLIEFSKVIAKTGTEMRIEKDRVVLIDTITRKAVVVHNSDLKNYNIVP